MTTPRLVLSLPLLFAIQACASPRDSLPRIADLYSEAASRHTRNPVIVIHGILGARLQQRSTGRTVWGAFTSDGIDPNTENGVRALGMPLVPPAGAYDPANEDVFAAGPLEALKLGLIFTVLNVEVYANIIRTLGAGGYTDNVAVDPLSPAYTDDHFTCFTFFYDWRRDNVQNAIRLGKFIRDKRAEIQRNATAKIARLREEGSAGAKKEAAEIEAWLAKGFRFDIVAHSMGGLVARYYLRYGERDLPADGSVPAVTWAGAKEIDRLIMVGTPNFGAMDALRNLVEGFTPAIILPHHHPVLIATMASIYQLLPRVRHDLIVDEDGEPVDLDLFDVDVWERNGWGLMDRDGDEYRAWLTGKDDAEENWKQAREYLRWCLDRARQFHAALDQRPPAPSRTRLYLFGSDTEDTITRARLEKDGDRLVPTFDDDDLYGVSDATVPRASTIADERFGSESSMWLDSPIHWTNVTFLADDHVGLTSNPHFSNNTLFVLLMTEPPK